MRSLYGLVLASGLLTSTIASAEPLLHPLFQDHLVLQRDQPIRIWGQAQPRERISVTLNEDKGETSADAGGRWMVELPALPAGSDLQLRASGSSGREQVVNDVAVGDVWLCSGQSNMVLQVHRALDARAEIANGNNPSIRMLTVPLSSSHTPQETFAAPVKWEPTTPETVAEFSAACFYFARELQKTVNVPMGLITSAWGGSKIESWISNAALRASGSYAEGLDTLKLYAANPATAYARWGKVWEKWWQSNNPQSSGRPWQVEPSGEWRAAPEGLGFWEQYGDPRLADHNGMVWYRTAVQISADQAQQSAVLSLGHVDEVEQTWINGEPLGARAKVSGRTTEPFLGTGPERTFRLPAGSFRAGKNVIVINVLDTYATGGLHGPISSRFIRFDGGAEVKLDGDWLYQPVRPELGTPPRAPWEPLAGLGVIHNSMIAPLGPLGLRGVAWYQGESNTGAPQEYEGLLTLLMSDWRSKFGEHLPFLIVQLANYGPAPTKPTESGWAELRDAQRAAVASDKHAALVITIDIGDRYDIHPSNKQEVGRRLARAARHAVYGESIVPSGPVAKSATRTEEGVVIEFQDVEGKLVAYSSASPIGFEVCGRAAESCRFVEARLDGTRVLLDRNQTGEASRIRYCWADSPVCTLFDEARLPAGPFQLEVK